MKMSDGLEDFAIHLVNVLRWLSSVQPLGETFSATKFHLDVQVFVVVLAFDQRVVGRRQFKRRGSVFVALWRNRWPFQITENRSEWRRRRFRCRDFRTAGETITLAAGFGWWQFGQLSSVLRILPSGRWEFTPGVKVTHYISVIQFR